MGKKFLHSHTIYIDKRKRNMNYESKHFAIFGHKRASGKGGKIAFSLCYLQWFSLLLLLSPGYKIRLSLSSQTRWAGHKSFWLAGVLFLFISLLWSLETQTHHTYSIYLCAHSLIRHWDKGKKAKMASHHHHCIIFGIFSIFLSISIKRFFGLEDEKFDLQNFFPHSHTNCQNCFG